MAYQGNGYDRHRQGEDIPMSHYNPGYNDDSLPLESKQVVIDINQRRGSDASSDTYPAIIKHDSSRRRWAATENPRDTAELINALPSRQLEQLASDVVNKSSLRRRKSSKRSFHGTMRAVRNNDLDELEQKLSKNEEFMDEFEGEARTTEILRDMPLSMSDKKKLKKSTSKRRKEITLQRGAIIKSPGWFKRAKYNFGITWMHFKQRLAEFAYSLELWRSHLKRIEGHFGTGVTSYFLFLKWIFLLNIPIFVLTFGFVVIPQIIYRYEIKNPPGYTTTGNISFTGEELLTGAGWFSDTEMYYGFYQQVNISLNSNTSYNMKYAYLFTCGGYYILCLIILALSISRSYKMNYIEGSGTHNFHNVSRVFCGWDYNITDQAAAKLKHKSFYNEMKEFLSGTKNKKQAEDNFDEKCKWFCIRVLTNLFILGMIGGLSYLVYEIVNQNFFVNGIPVLKEMALSLIISAIILVFPPIFSLIARLENYKQPKNELIINMIRTMLLKTSILAILVFFRFRHAGDKYLTECWETKFGQEIYRLVLVDFIFILGATFCLEFLRRIFGTYCCKITRPEFDIGRNTLDLIYAQGLCWLGTFYSPLLSAIMIVKLFLIFYVKMISVLQNCQPSLRPWRASRTHTIFLGFLFFFFILATVAVAVGIITVSPSKICGPYKNVDKAYDVVIALVDSWKGNLTVLHQIIKIISSPGFVASVLVALCVGTYYMRIIMIGHKEMVKLLRQQLAMEGRDKAYLLNMLQNVSRKKKSKLNPSNVNRLLSPTTGNTNNHHLSPGGKQFARTVADSVAAASSVGFDSSRFRRRGDINGGIGAAPH